MTPDQTSAALGIKRDVHRTVNRDSRHRLSTLFEKYTVGVIVLRLEYQMTRWARSVRWERPMKLMPRVWNRSSVCSHCASLHRYSFSRDQRQ